MVEELQPRTRGVRNPKIGVPEIPEIGRPDAQPVRASAYQTFANTVQGLMQSNQQAAATAQGIIENIAGIEQARGVQRASRLLPRGDNSTGRTVESIMAFADRAFQTYNSIEERRRQRELERLKAEEAQRAALQEAAYTEADYRLTSELLPHARAALMEQGGFQQYKRFVDSWLDEYRELLSPADFTKLVNKAYEPVLAVEEQFANNRYELANRTQDELREANVAKFMLENSNRLARIATSRNPQEATQLVEEVIQYAAEFVASSDPFTAAFTMSRVLQELQGRYDTSSAAFSGLTQRIESYHEYALIMQEAQNEFDRTGDFNAWQYTEATARARYEIPGELAVRDPTQQAQVRNQLLQAEQDRLELQRSRSTTALENLEYTNAEMVSIAYLIYADPSMKPILERDFAGSTLFDQAVILAEQMREFDTRGAEIQQDIQRLEIQARQIQTLNLSNIAEWMDTAGNQESLADLLQVPGIRAAIGEQQAAILQALQQGQQVDPAELQAARQAVIDARSSILDVINAQVGTLTSTYNQMEQRLAIHKMNDPSQREVTAAGAAETLNGLRGRVSELRQASQRTFGATPNFDPPRLATVDVNGQQLITPFAIGDAGQLWLTSGYGAERPSGPHAGVDIAVPVGTSLFSYVPGKVVYAEYVDRSDYGLFVDIESEDGYIHRFAHLSYVGVQIGDQIAAGQEFGKTGNTGNTTGPHLHWEVRTTAQGYWDGSTDPWAYVAGLQQGVTRQVRNGGQPPPAMPAGAIDNGDGTYIYNNEIHYPNGASAPFEYAGTSPYRQRYASIRREDYGPNDGAGNFGYARLQQDRTLRIALHRTASRIGIPAQWLADLIAFETGGRFSPGVWNPNHPAVGLIQFYEDSPGSGRKTIGGRTYALSEIANMSVERQFELVYDYLAPMKSQITSPHHLLMAVWGGSGNLDRLVRNGFESVRNLSDGDITFGEYSRRLGSHAGRQYAPMDGSGGPVHTRARAGCAVCQNIVTSLSDPFPHRG
jgi:murein DD-endopeptidase MepM/ murein hydrolase activator NlpD